MGVPMSNHVGLRKIKNIQFTVNSPQDILKMSVCHVDKENFEGGKVREGGLFDYRMGTLNKNRQCQTCNQDIKGCPGHFGHIELPRPMYHPGFVERLVEILKCVCHHCSRLMVETSDPKFQKIQKQKNPEVRIRDLIKLCKKKVRCDFPNDKSGEGTGCQGFQPMYKIEDNIKIVAELEAPLPEWDNKNKIHMSAQQTLTIMKRIEVKDFPALGCHSEFIRPDWLIFTVFPVPPPPIRPSNMSNAAARGEDDLTHKLSDIVRARNNLQSKIMDGASELEIQTFVQMLQHHIATYIDSESVVQQNNQRNGKIIKCVQSRLKGKDGRLRGNLMGKRVDFTGRTVITPDPDIGVDEIGVPWDMSKILTFPEPVNDRNIEELRKRIIIGPYGDNGANYILLENETERVDLRFCTDRAKIAQFLEPGMKVERHLADGDVVLVNRQPSLHRFSIMAHRVRIMPYSTLRLNLSVTTPYNADFDGDEMNIQVMQSYETMAEALELMAVEHNMTTPQSNKPVMGIVQDALLGAKLLTDRDTFLTREEVMQRLAFVGTFKGALPMPTIWKPVPLWTGKQLISAILPELNLDRFSTEHPSLEDDGPYAWISPTDTRVTIRGGELLAGNLCKRTLGNTAGSLIHVIYNDFGPLVNLQFMNDVQRISSEYIVEYGVSVGLKDMRVPDGIEEKIVDMLKVVQEELNFMQKAKIPPKEFEKKANQLLNNVRKKAAEDTIKSLDKKNVLKQQLGAASKGSSVNPAQMIRCVGQQNIDGQRIPFGFQGRTLPHFKKGDNGPRARGFVKGRYVDGLAPDEFYFHAMAGREGISDTSVKTSDIGYVQRKLAKAMEDLGIKYDRTVRNSQGEIIQFVPGEDGIDASTMENQTIESIHIGQALFCKRFEWKKEQRLLDAGRWLTKEWNRLRKDYVWGKGRKDKAQALPVNVRRMIDQLPRSKNPFQPQDAPMISKTIFQLQKRIQKVQGDQVESVENPFFVMLRSVLASKRIVKEWKMDETGLAVLCKKIEARYIRSLSSPGDTTGTTAAQSIGEPATQMTLRTFHAIGQSEKNVTLGVPRLKEIVNAAKKTKTPSLTVYLKPAIAKSKELVTRFAKNIEYLLLGDVIEMSMCLYDPDGNAVAKDVELVQQFQDIPDTLEGDGLEWSQYVLRMTLQKKILQERNITLQSIVDTIKSLYGNTMQLQWNDEYAEEVIIRVRPRSDANSLPGEDYYMTLELEHMMKQDIQVCGIKGITKSYVREDPLSPTEYIIDTNGVNLLVVLGRPEVDASRTYTNDIHESLSVFGIEGARKTILRELVSVLSFDDNYVNIRHPAVLSDVMTHSGYIMSMTRHGINRKECGPLIMASFEETPDVLTNAARFYKLDNIKGVTENIIIGTRPPIGTGTFDLFIDINKISSLEIPEAKSSETSKIKKFTFSASTLDPSSFMPSSPVHNSTWVPTSPLLHEDPIPTMFDYPILPQDRRSPSYKLTSPSYVPTSPSYVPTSPSYVPTTPSYIPTDVVPTDMDQEQYGTNI